MERGGCGTDRPVVAVCRVDAFCRRGRGSQELQLCSLVWRDWGSGFEELEILCCEEFDEWRRRRKGRAQRRLARLHRRKRGSQERDAAYLEVERAFKADLRALIKVNYLS
jgi:hypothetical protein